MKIVRALLVRSLRRPVGIFRLFAGAVAELVLSALYAPSMMIIQCRQLVEIVRGRDSGWSTQRRGDGTTPWGEIVRRHWMQTLIGIALTFASCRIRRRPKGRR